MKRRSFLHELGLSGLGAASLARIGSASGALLGTLASRGAQAAPFVAKIALYASRVVMPVTIAGKGPYLFMIDTGGATNMIDGALAQELDLHSSGSVRAKGVGGAIVLKAYTAHDVVFGGQVRQPTVSLLEHEGTFERGVRGSLAAGILTTLDCDLDMAQGQWRLYSDGAPERTGFVRIANGIRSKSDNRQASSPRLYGPVSVDGKSVDCLLDTGAPQSLTLSHSTARKLGLWDDARPYVPQATFGIAGSGGVGRLIRVESLDFGGARFERALVVLRAQRDSTRDAEGILGLTVLRRFDLSTEVRTRSLLLKRQDASPLPDRYGMSGLWLSAMKGGVEVVAVGTGSPAAAAGVQVGDHVEGVSLPQAIRAIGGEPGKAVALDIRSPKGEKRAAFTLRPYL